MSDERLGKLWNNVKHIVRVDRMGEEALLALGSVFGEMKGEIKKLQEDIKQLENQLEGAYFDTHFDPEPKKTLKMNLVDGFQIADIDELRV